MASTVEAHGGDILRMTVDSLHVCWYLRDKNARVAHCQSERGGVLARGSGGGAGDGNAVRGGDGHEAGAAQSDWDGDEGYALAARAACACAHELVNT
eukprot:6178002-Pleurochrysis_carterae.AAC.1